MRTPVFQTLALEKLMTTHLDPHYAAANDYYAAGAQRIIKQLVAAGLPCPRPESLRSALLDYFDTCDYVQARGLREPTDPSDWQLVTPIALPQNNLLSGPSLASDRTEALAAVLNCCDEERMFPTACEATTHGLRLYQGQAILAEISRIKFEPYRRDQIERVTSVFKGIRCRGEEGRIAARMRTLPGFDKATFQIGRPFQRLPEGNMLLPSPSNWATAMMLVMQKLKVPVKRHVALELVSSLFAVSSWQHLIARRNEERVWERPSCLSDDDDNPRAWRFYKTSAQAIFSLGLVLREYRDRMPIVDMVHRGSTGDAGVVVGATMLASTASGMNTRTGIICHSPERVEILAPSYWAIANAFLARFDGGIDPMPLVLSTGELATDVRAANVRLGSRPDQTLQFDEWWFRIVTDRTTYLDIERLIPGVGRAVSRRIALYKTTVRYDANTHHLRITEDYDREEVAALDNFSQEEADRLRDLIVTADLGPHEGLWGNGDIRGELPIIRGDERRL